MTVTCAHHETIKPTCHGLIISGAIAVAYCLVGGTFSVLTSGGVPQDGSTRYYKNAPSFMVS